MSGGDIAMPGFDSEPKPSRRLWMLAGLGALVLHLGGGALAVAHLRFDDPGDTLGAPAIEIGLQMTSPDVEPTDLPPGPDTDPSVASPAMAEQKAEVKETELPKAVPTETEDPDRAVTPNDSKPREDDAKMAAVATNAAVESPAVEATAKQAIDASAPKSEVAMAPNIGLGKDDQKLKAKWESKISAYFQRHMVYPKVRKSKAEVVTVSLVLDRLGHVVSVGVFQSSGDPAFDEAAVSAIRRSDPVPRPPSALTAEQFSYTLAMKYTD